MIKNALWLTNPSSIAPCPTTTMCRTQWLFSISYKMLLDPVKVHQSVDNRRGRTAANLRPINHPVLPWQGLQSKYEYQVKKMSTSLPEALTHGAFITWKCNKIFLRLSYLCYIHKDHIVELQKNAVSTTASHWCSYSNLGFNRYQSKLPSKKSREVLLIAHRYDNEELWGKKISNFS